MKIPHFKKGLKVQFVEAATDFIDPPTQNLSLIHI